MVTRGIELLSGADERIDSTGLIEPDGKNVAVPVTRERILFDLFVIQWSQGSGGVLLVDAEKAPGP